MIHAKKSQILEAGILDRAMQILQSRKAKKAVDSLLAAYKAGGAPTDSAEVESFLLKNGVDRQTIDKLFLTYLKIPVRYGIKKWDDEAEQIFKKKGMDGFLKYWDYRANQLSQDKQPNAISKAKAALAANDLKTLVSLIKNLSPEDLKSKRAITELIQKSKLAEKSKNLLYKQLLPSSTEDKQKAIIDSLKTNLSSGSPNMVEIARAIKNITTVIIDDKFKNEIKNLINTSKLSDVQKTKLLNYLKLNKGIDESKITWLSINEFKHISKILLESGFTWPMLGYTSVYKTKGNKKVGLVEYASGGSTSAGNVASVASPMGAVIRRMPAGQSFFGPAAGKVKKRKKSAKSK